MAKNRKLEPSAAAQELLGLLTPIAKRAVELFDADVERKDPTMAAVAMFLMALVANAEAREWQFLYMMGNIDPSQMIPIGVLPMRVTPGPGGPVINPKDS